MDLDQDLSAEELELLSYMLEEAGVDVGQQQTIPRRTHNENLPLSFAQARLWFLDQLEPGTSAYNITFALKLVGVMQTAMFVRCLNLIVQRHEILRTTFSVVDGDPIQVIAPTTELHIPVIDLQSISQDDRTHLAQQCAYHAAQQSFDLTHGPLLQAVLVRLTNDEHIVLLIVHHIVFDGWSTGILMRELLGLYDALVADEPLPLPELPIQYADFALWQQEQLRNESLQEQMIYWKEKLADTSLILDLPTDHPRPPVQTFHGRNHRFHIPSATVDGLQALGQQEGATLFMTLMTSFMTLLYRYTQQHDLRVGSPIAGRRVHELEGLIGCFVNMLVMQSALKGQLPFREALQQVREVALEAFANQDLPFEQLVEELQPARDMSRNPLFQVMLVLQNAPTTNLERAGLRFEPIEFERTNARFDLSFFLREFPDGIHGIAEYATDLFDEATVVRLTDHFYNILESVIKNPDQRLSDIPILSAKEQQQLLYDWNATTTTLTPHDSLVTLFETQVVETPDAVAVVDQHQTLSYASLNAESNRLAHQLQALDIGPEARVGIYVERSTALLISLLGVLKVGGTYVPLDPTYPPDRLAFILDNAQAQVLITQETLASTLPHHQAQIVSLDGDAATIAYQSADNLSQTITPDHVAYVIYTSGSTGRPKGVQISHQAVFNFLRAMAKQPGITAQDRLLAVTTIAFDIAVLELFLPLISGSQVIIVDRATAADGVALTDQLATHQATVLQATPATWRLLLETDWQPSPSLQQLCGGEAITSDLAHGLTTNDSQLWNMYGPTETTVWSATRSISVGETPVLIGGPIDNTQLYILDDFMHLMPIGIPGELCIGGAGLARGYAARPALTAERFVVHPYAESPGQRIYRTGDRARYRRDGTIEYLGRLDHQVKLRGFRIELGEIEAVLSQHPAVHMAIAIVREDDPGDPQLVAYVTSQQDQQPVAEELKTFLRQKVPEYMIPSAFVVLEHLPMTPNGKVDRRALPRPDQSQSMKQRTYVAPRTVVEEVLVLMWHGVLNVEQIGVTDNFFQLGGHSLKAARLVALIRKTFQIDIPLRQLFEMTTVATLAEYLVAHEAKPGQTEKIAEIFKRIRSTSAEDRQKALAAKRQART